VTPPGDANSLKNAIFRTFHTAGTAEHNFDTARRSFDTAKRQALIFWALGATYFSSLRSFRRIAFPNLLTV